MIVPLILLTGCSAGEAQHIEKPYCVDMLRSPVVEESEHIEVAEAVVKEEVEITIQEEEKESERISEVVEENHTACLTATEIVVEEVQDSCFEEPVETGNYYEDIPDESSEVWQYEEPAGMQLLGVYYITHYSAEGCGNNIGAAEVPGGMVEGISIAMPERWMLGRWVYVEGYGEFRVDDISPDGIADIFHYAAASAVGADYQNVYLID